jgi:hypothetical protein
MLSVVTGVVDRSRAAYLGQICLLAAASINHEIMGVTLGT